MPQGRPTILANNNPTIHISAFVDHFLRPIVMKGKTYIKDNSDFINKLSKIDNVNENSLLVSELVIYQHPQQRGSRSNV